MYTQIKGYVYVGIYTRVYKGYIHRYRDAYRDAYKAEEVDIGMHTRI